MLTNTSKKVSSRPILWVALFFSLGFIAKVCLPLSGKLLGIIVVIIIPLSVVPLTR